MLLKSVSPIPITVGFPLNILAMAKLVLESKLNKNLSALLVET